MCFFLKEIEHWQSNLLYFLTQTLETKVWRRQWHPTPVLLPGKSHGWRSLEGCSPRGRWGLDMTERLHFNPLQCSCLENPRDGGTRWAAVYGVAQSRTRLKRLSSSSSSRNRSYTQKNKSIWRGQSHVTVNIEGSAIKIWLIRTLQGHFLIHWEPYREEKPPPSQTRTGS